jgi:hypothetical protein
MGQKPRIRPHTGALALFLLVALVLVHCVGSPSAGLAQGKSGPQATLSAVPRVMYGTADLPAPVQEMREAILSAVSTGRIEDLRHAYELNELKPDLAAKSVADPVAFWKQISVDGRGLEVLAALGQILEAGYVVLPTGRDLENNRIYVWPYFAEVPLAGLTPAQDVELMRLLGAATARELKATGRYSWWRIAIGADGVWHSFRRMP